MTACTIPFTPTSIWSKKHTCPGWHLCLGDDNLYLVNDNLYIGLSNVCHLVPCICSGKRKGVLRSEDLSAQIIQCIMSHLQGDNYLHAVTFIYCNSNCICCCCCNCYYCCSGDISLHMWNRSFWLLFKQ